MKSILLSIAIVGLLSAQAQTLKVTNEKDKQLALQNLNNKYPAYAAIAKQIWANAELGFQEVKSRNFVLEFTYPTEEERRQMKVINKDQSPQERELRNQRQRSFKELVTSLEKGEISTEDLPEEYLEKFKNYLPK